MRGMRADDPRLADAPVPTHVTARMVAYSRRTQAYEKRKEATAVRLVAGPALFSINSITTNNCA